MIRYRFSSAELFYDISKQDATEKRRASWLAKAHKRTAELKNDPKKKITSVWSEVKRVYTLRQNGKCAFCERLLGKHELSSNEFDVEHFRPKSKVLPWPTPTLAEDLGLPADFPRSSGRGAGYRLLAYNPLNYASSCKTCNARLKGSFFPVAKRHKFGGIDPAALLAEEQPYLIYPLADFDEDPEQLIDFVGYMAKPAQPPGDRYRHDRGRVTIVFFRLNDERDDLLLLRAKQLDNVYSKLENFLAARSAQARTQTWQDIERLSSASNDHAGCVRSFLRQYGAPDEEPIPAGREAALTGLQLARDYVRSILKL